MLAGWAGCLQGKFGAAIYADWTLENGLSARLAGDSVCATPLPMSSPASGSPSYNLHLALNIFARESQAPFLMRRQGIMGIVRQTHPEAPQLEGEIREIQVRLGTTDERPGDFDRVKVAAHRLGNLMCLVMLAQGLRERPEPACVFPTPSIPLPAGTESPFATA